MSKDQKEVRKGLRRTSRGRVIEAEETASAESLR